MTNEERASAGRIIRLFELRLAAMPVEFVDENLDELRAWCVQRYGHSQAVRVEAGRFLSAVKAQLRFRLTEGPGGFTCHSLSSFSSASESSLPARSPVAKSTCRPRSGSGPLRP